MANRSSCRWPRNRFASLLLLSVLATDLSAAGPDVPQVLADSAFDAAAASLAGETLFLEVLLNGAATGRILRFVHENGRFHAGADSLRLLGFDMKPGAGAIDLGTLEGVGIDYDAQRQRIDIAAPALLASQSRTRLNDATAGIPRPQASPGALVNYDLYATADESGARSVSAFAELRSFGRLGVFSTSWLGRGLDAPAGAPSAQSQRLDTSWTRSFVDTATVLRIGDAIAGSLAWTRATRYGGVQLRRDFALQPELITFPVPAFLGQATLPSTIDLYVDGLRQYSSQAPAGPFQLDSMPIVNGSGDAQVVVTDALGRQQTYDFSFYTSNQLLRAGLSDWSLDLGFVREDYGQRSFGYADAPSASGTWRRGMTDHLTLEAHAEATHGLAAGGAGAVLQLGGAGTLTGSYARSEHAGEHGEQVALGYSWRNRWFNFALDSVRGTSYADIASLEGNRPPTRSDRALVGFTTPRLGGFGANYVQLAYPGQPRSRYASAFWFRSFGSRFALSANLNQNLDDDADQSAFVSLSVSLGSRASAGVTAQHDPQGNAATLDVASSIPSEGGLGWRARVHDGEQTSGQAELGWRAQHTEGVAGLQHQSGASSGYAGVGGAFVLMDQHVYATRRVDQAFAVVATGMPGVPVLLSNREVGRTDGNGNLLVTPLNAYQRNLVSIDPMQLSADLSIERVESEVVPADRSGTLVDFRVKPALAASLILHDERGQAIAVGSVIERDGEPVAMVGYDGAAYLEGLAPDNEIVVRHAAGHCRVRFRYDSDAGGVPLLGPLRCVKE
jgi:outer membrane usher protein